MTALLAFTAAAPAPPVMPDWAPLVFGVGSLLVLVLVIVLARRKMNDSARWQQRTQDSADGDGPGPDPRQDPPRNDGS